MRILRNVIAFALAIGFIVLSGLAAAPFLINAETYKNQVLASIEALTGIVPSATGKVKITFLPSPTVQIDNLTLPNMKGAATSYIFMARRLKVDASFFKLLIGQVTVNNITMIDPLIELEELSDGRKNWHMITGGDKNARIKGVIPRLIKMKNAALVYRSPDNEERMNNLDFILRSDSFDGPFSLEGRVQKLSSFIKFTAEVGNVKEHSDINIRLFSDTFDLALKGSGDGKYTFTGQVEGNIKKLQDFFKAYSNTNSLFYQMTSSESLELQGDFTFSPSVLNFQNVILNSPSITGRANIQTSPDNSAIWDIDVAMQKLDVDTLFARSGDEEEDFYDPLEGGGSIHLDDFSLDAPEQFSLLFSFAIDEVLYKKNKISDVHIEADLFNRIAVIHSIDALLPGQTRFGVKGIVSHNGIRPLFKGSMHVSGNKLRTLAEWLFPSLSFIPQQHLNTFLFKSDFTITPKKLSFKDIKGAVDRSSLTGYIGVRPDEQVSSIEMELDLDRLDMDDYKITDKIYTSLGEFFSSMDNKNLETSSLKTFPYKMLIKSNIDKLNFNKNELKDISLQLSLAPGVFNIQRANFTSPLGDMGIMFNINLSKEDMPDLNLDMRSNILDTALFLPPEQKKQKEEYTRWAWSKEPFNSLGLDKFHGGFKFAVGQLKHKALLFNNLNIDAKLDKKVITLEKGEAGLFGGTVQVKGNIGVTQRAQSLGLAVAMENVDTKSFLSAFIPEPKIDGKFFTSATITTFGASPAGWIKELKSEGKMAIKQASLLDLDIVSLARAAPRLYSALDLDTLAQKSMHSGASSFNDINGIFSITNSVAQIRNVQFISSIVRGAGAGVVDMNTLLANAISKFSFLPEEGKSVTLTLNTKGSIFSLENKLDTTDLERYITSKSAR